MSAASGLMFLSTPPVWVATFGKARSHSRPLCFYPRHPCGWRRENRLHKLPQVLFLSTPPVWVATGKRKVQALFYGSFYPRHPCGWRPRREPLFPLCDLFLSTPPVWVATAISTSISRTSVEFLSTPPVWVATICVEVGRFVHDVSIHATRVGGDRNTPCWTVSASCFYPRHPCGWRRRVRQRPMRLQQVSIHATRVGGDPAGTPADDLAGKFLSTPPVWVATADIIKRPTNKASFYPRHPCGWRQQKCTKMDTLLRKSVNFSFQFIKNKKTKKIYKKLIEHYIFSCLNCLVRSP